MTEAVKKMLLNKANEEYLKKVEERKKQDKQLAEEVERIKKELNNDTGTT